MPRGDDIQRLTSFLQTAENKLMGAAAQGVKTGLERCFVDSFAQARDVNGKAFRRPKDGHSPPMFRTGALMNAIVGGVTIGPGWNVTASEETDYGKFLRDGTSKMDARQFIPKPAQPLPVAWDRKVRAEMDRALRGVQ